MYSSKYARRKTSTTGNHPVDGGLLSTSLLEGDSEQQQLFATPETCLEPSTETEAETVGTGVNDAEKHSVRLSGSVQVRPDTLKDYPGQRKIVRQVEIAVKAATARGDSLTHMLLSGPPGLGKTTLAHIVANQMGVKLVLTSGPNLRKPGDLVSQLVNLEDREILFIDEIHRMDRTVEEILYPAMEDYKIDVITGSEETHSRNSITLPLSKLTIIGATTRPGMLQNPLRDRFGMNLQFDYYTPEELATILTRTSTLHGIHLNNEALHNLARRSRGTPRIANRLFDRCRDWVQVETNHPHTINSIDVDECLHMNGVDHAGLDDRDNRLMQLLSTTYRNRPVGLTTLAAALGEETETLSESVEPYLLRAGYLSRTPQGRLLTETGLKHVEQTKHNQT